MLSVISGVMTSPTMPISYDRQTHTHTQTSHRISPHQSHPTCTSPGSQQTSYDCLSSRPHSASFGVAAAADTEIPIRTSDQGLRTRLSLVQIRTNTLHITHRHRRGTAGFGEGADRRIYMTTSLRMALASMVDRALEGEAIRKFSRRLSDLRPYRFRVYQAWRHILCTVPWGGRVRSLDLVR